jgi:hypothetical protein
MAIKLLGQGLTKQFAAYLMQKPGAESLGKLKFFQKRKRFQGTFRIMDHIRKLRPNSTPQND